MFLSQKEANGIAIISIVILIAITLVCIISGLLGWQMIVRFLQQPKEEIQKDVLIFVLAAMSIITVFALLGPKISNFFSKTK